MTVDAIVDGAVGAELIVYRKGQDVGETTGATTEDDQPNVDDETVGQDENLNEKQGSDCEQGFDSEQSSSGEQDSDSEQDSGIEHDPDSSKQSLAEVETSNISSDPDANLASLSDPANEDCNAALGIYQINSIPLMNNDAPLPNLSPHAFSIRIAELYGPLPADPHILNKIPSTLRPYAYKKIYFPLETLAETVLLDRKR